MQKTLVTALAASATPVAPGGHATGNCHRGLGRASVSLLQRVRDVVPARSRKDSSRYGEDQGPANANVTLAQAERCDLITKRVPKPRPGDDQSSG
jgi:hypothetical protein